MKMNKINNYKVNGTDKARTQLSKDVGVHGDYVVYPERGHNRNVVSLIEDIVLEGEVEQAFADSPNCKAWLVKFPNSKKNLALLAFLEQWNCSVTHNSKYYIVRVWLGNRKPLTTSIAQLGFNASYCLDENQRK